MRKNPLIKAVGLAGVSALALTACGGPIVDGGNNGGSDPSANQTEATDWSTVEPAKEITFWSTHPGGSMDFEKEIAAKFEAETGIKVDLITAGATYEEIAQRFQTAQTAGDQGDVVVMSDANWFSAYLAGSITSVDDLVAAADNDTSTYVDALYEDYLYDGKHWAVPYGRSTPLFYYNKEHYADAGLPDQAPATWDELREYADKLAAAGHTTAFAFPPEAEYPAWTMANLVWSFGGGWSNEWDFSQAYSEGTVAALKFAQEALADGWAAVASASPQTDFAAGANSSVVASTGALRSTIEAASFDIGVGFLPTGPSGATDVVPTGGAGLAIASKSAPEKQKAAAMFVSFMTSTENTAAFSGLTGYLPVRKDADMSAVYAENPLFEVAVQQLERAHVQDFGRVLLPGGDIALARGLNEVLVQKADPEETMKKVADEMTTLYDRDLKSVLEG
ncbi:ABC transporter substrate-binding protein [Tessaracoccus caeni]|uniref:ABC transporter substrate-binding protein n=1 Tax=Tessaracoccus caeni TaxID=3031239 RepID=UPI0023DB8495|nr:ABC transporter substrate-binding protein [Tessaracoccus caeni]MDF1487521.1 ABC transporter substrate-binding protein [Tessaracoccus caeni]